MIGPSVLALIAMMSSGCGVTSHPSSSNMAAPEITTQPANKTVPPGQTATFSVANTGTDTELQWMKNGTAIGGAISSSYTTPATATSDNGSLISVQVSNDAGSVTSTPATLTVSGGTLVLNTSTASLNFGAVNVSTSGMQSVVITNAGTANVAISSISVAGPGFNASGISSGTVLSPGQVATLNVTFAPAANGSVTGSVTVTSNSLNGAKVIALAGTGGTSVGHTVDLSWTPSISAVVGYNVYASNVSGSSYVKLTSSPIATVGYVDSSLQTAQVRYYVATAVDSNNIESTYSTEISVTIP